MASDLEIIKELEKEIGFKLEKNKQSLNFVSKSYQNKNDPSIKFQANIWDFGGQEIMHATHRYFLTKRSLYIVLADNRKEDTDFYYWLDNVELLSNKSPVLVVLNEKHEHRKYIPTDILKYFKTVKKTYNVNLADNTGLSTITKAVQKHISLLDHIGKEAIPKKWAEIRQFLETKEDDYISRSEFLKICMDNEIKDEKKALFISDFLHDLGVILHFQNDRLLKNTVILNTSWATKAVYLILFDKTVISNFGKFDNTDLERIWHSSEYIDKDAELMQLMINFKLCYEIGNSQKYIIPELLPEKPINREDFLKKTENQDMLYFQYHYVFMPKGLVAHLIVQMNKYIYNNLQWKNGVVLKIKQTKAEIIEDFYQRKLKIRVLGTSKLEALTIIIGHIKELHKGVAKITTISNKNRWLPNNGFLG